MTPIPAGRQHFPGILALNAESVHFLSPRSAQQLEHLHSSSLIRRWMPRTLPAKLTIITADDIKKTGAKTVQEAIQWATGIVMYDSIGNAFQQTIDLRGFNGGPVTGTSVFVDGVRINEPDFNSVNFDLVAVDTIERIEILPSSSAIFGKNSLGGAINIMTKRGTDKHQATGETLWGSFGPQRYSINANGPIGKFDYYTRFSRESEDGYRRETDAGAYRFFGKVGYRPSQVPRPARAGHVG